MSANINQNTIEVFNPVNNKKIKKISITSKKEFDKIIDNADLIKNGWNNSTTNSRINLIKKFRKKIIKNMDEFINTICMETGKKKFESMLEVLTSVEHMKHTEKILKKIFKKKKRKVGTLIFKKAWTEFYPMGIAGIISPWNYPLILTLTPVIEALAGGNVVILKPSEQTPLTTKLLQKIWNEATNNHAALQTIYGAGEVGNWLVNSNKINVISFTGSTKIGKIIASDCAKNLKPVILELGGNDPMIICEDADINKAVNAAVWGGMSNAGQTCISVERIFIHENIQSKFVAKISEKIKKLSAGSSENSMVGSITVPEGLKKIKSQVKTSQEASKIIQGSIEKSTGLYYPPTLIIEPNLDGELMQNETFGPVISISSYKTDGEAIALANSTDYGLSASVFSNSPSRAKKIASKIRSGSVTINDVMSHYGIADLPFGGVGLSGNGRVHGEEGIKSFCIQKSYMVNRLNLGDEIWWYDKSKKYEKLIYKFIKLYFG